jgi:hypothetical protein
MTRKKQNVQINTKRQMTSPIARLIRIGRRKSYVTYNDILKVIPQPENHMQYVELVFATLLAVNIPYVDDKE